MHGLLVSLWVFMCLTLHHHNISLCIIYFIYLSTIYYILSLLFFCGGDMLQRFHDANVLWLRLALPEEQWAHKIKLTAIEFTVDSHDQGWSSYPADHGIIL